MATIFISHSKRDIELVNSIKIILENIGHVPIIEEYIPKENQAEIPYEEIRKNVMASDYMFLFLTDNVTSTEYTKNWVIWETSLAVHDRKRLFVFERYGSPIKFPIPYFTDYAVFDPNTNDLLHIQKLMKNLDSTNSQLAGAGVGFLLGLPFGPLGMILGPIAGTLIGKNLSNKVSGKSVKCGNCKIEFQYYSSYIEYVCPACRVKNVI